MLRGLQRLGRWMLCLALIAQIGGVVPLVYVDTGMSIVTPATS